MKKLLIMAGVLGAAIAGWRLVQGWRDNTPSARQLKEEAREASGVISENDIPARNPIYAMG